MTDLPAQALMHTTDPLTWANTFCETFDGRTIGRVLNDVDASDLHTWFANAIEVGRNQGRRELCPHPDHRRYDWADLHLCLECGTTLHAPKEHTDASATR
jgi:hypothetical protein